MNDLEQRVKELEARFAILEKSDRYTFQKTIEILDGRKIQVGKATGTIIATASIQKLGFFGAPAIAQPSSPTFPSGGLTVDSQSRASINQIINTLSKNSGGLGLTA